jgi:hypothetical protein
MNHFKYLGKFVPATDNIVITDCDFNYANTFIIKVPRDDYHVIVAFNDDDCRSLITIHRDNFSHKDKRNKIYRMYFKESAIFTDMNDFENGKAINRYNMCNADLSFDLDQEKKFAYVHVPKKQCYGGVYQYSNNNEITALEITLFCNK